MELPTSGTKSTPSSIASNQDQKSPEKVIPEPYEGHEGSQENSSWNKIDGKAEVLNDERSSSTSEMAPHARENLHVPDETMFIVEALLDLKEGPTDSHSAEAKMNLQHRPPLNNSLVYNPVPSQPSLSSPYPRKEPFVYSYLDGEIQKVEQANGHEKITLNKGFIGEGEELLSSGNSGDRSEYLQNGPSGISVQASSDDTMTIDEALINIERNMLNDYDEVEEREVNFEDEYCNSEFIEHNVISEPSDEMVDRPCKQSPYILNESVSFRDMNLNACRNVVPDDNICISSIEEVPHVNSDKITKSPEIRVVSSFTSIQSDSVRNGSSSLPANAPMLVVNKKNEASKKYYYQKTQPISRYTNPNEQKWSFLTIFNESASESSDETLSDIEEHSAIPIRRKLIRKNDMKLTPSSPFYDSSSSSSSASDNEAHSNKKTVLQPQNKNFIVRNNSAPPLYKSEVIPDYEQEVEIGSNLELERNSRLHGAHVSSQIVSGCSSVGSQDNILKATYVQSSKGIKKTYSADNVDNLLIQYSPSISQKEIVNAKKRKRKISQCPEISNEVSEVGLRQMPSVVPGLMRETVLTSPPKMLKKDSPLKPSQAHNKKLQPSKEKSIIRIPLSKSTHSLAANREKKLKSQSLKYVTSPTEDGTVSDVAMPELLQRSDITPKNNPSETGKNIKPVKKTLMTNASSDMSKIISSDADDNLPCRALSSDTSSKLLSRKVSPDTGKKLTDKAVSPDACNKLALVSNVSEYANNLQKHAADISKESLAVYTASPISCNDPFSIKKRLIQQMGLTIDDYDTFLDGCKSPKAKHDKLLAFMRENGLKGKPSLENCMKAKILREAVEAVQKNNESLLNKVTDTEEDTFNNNLEAKKQSKPLSKSLPEKHPPKRDRKKVHSRKLASVSTSTKGQTKPVKKKKPKSLAKNDKIMIEFDKLDDVIRFEVEIESD